MTKVKIGVMEMGAVEGEMMPIYMGVQNVTTVKGKHAVDVIKTLRRFSVEEIEVYLLPATVAGLKRALTLDLNILNLSYTGVNGDGNVTDELEKELSKKTLIVSSAGNDGSGGEAKASSREQWLAVGAINEKLEPRSYSSYGLGKVITVGIDGYDGNFGTSFSAPYVVGLISHYYKRFHDAFGYFPSPMQAREWVKFNSHDVFDEGWDLRTGYGLLKLPKRWEFKESVYTLGASEKVVRKCVNGEISEKTVPVYIPFQIINKRSLVNPRDIVDDVHGTTHWVQETRTAHFSR